MRAVKSRNTEPELKVRRLIHGMGYRYRLHGSHLPGNPDLVFGPRRKVVFVHGCFWHGHNCKRGDRIPKTNRTYWRKKIETNRQRDIQNLKSLQRIGWQALVVWECEIANSNHIAERVRDYLEGAD